MFQHWFKNDPKMIQMTLPPQKWKKFNFHDQRHHENWKKMRGSRFQKVQNCRTPKIQKVQFEKISIILKMIDMYFWTFFHLGVQWTLDPLYFRLYGNNGLTALDCKGPGPGAPGPGPLQSCYTMIDTKGTQSPQSPMSHVVAPANPPIIHAGWRVKP